MSTSDRLDELEAATPEPASSLLPDTIGLLARIVLGGAMIWAGMAKILEGPLVAARAVQAFDVLPFDVAKYVGYGLPYVEVALGLLVVLGLFTRFAAAALSLLLVVFIAGIAQAWYRGLTIDCGCFGGGGTVAANQTAYPQEILRDAGMLLCGLWLVRRPRSLFALDRMWG